MGITMQKLLTILLLGMITGGFNMPAWAAEDTTDTHVKPAAEKTDEEPDCE